MLKTLEGGGVHDKTADKQFLWMEALKICLTQLLMLKSYVRGMDWVDLYAY